MRNYFILALLATMFVACTSDQTEDVALKVEENVIYASIDEPECRVQLNEKCQTVWTKNDQIVVFNVNEYALYQFMGKTGDRSGSFTRVGSGQAPGNSYKFDQYYALFFAPVLVGGLYVSVLAMMGVALDRYLPGATPCL